MKIYNRLFILFLLAHGAISLGAQEKKSAFNMQRAVDSKLSINKQLRSDATFAPFNKTEALSGLSVSGDIQFTDPWGLVRILLTDENGEDHLVYEAYPALGEGMNISFENVCEETALLDGVKPQNLKVIVDKAELNLRSLSAAYATGKSAKGAELLRAKATLKKDQLTERIRRINDYNMATNKTWFADTTTLAKMNYADRKYALHATSDDFNTFGYEYYASGYFYLPSTGDNANSSEELSLAESEEMELRSTTTFVDEFDWRNRHGVNWITPPKDQGVTKTCWAFGAVACVEAMTNLYLNKKIDLDLSEQHLASIYGYNNKPGYTSLGLGYFYTYGIVTEECFPFVNSLDSIPLDLCENPSEEIKIEGGIASVPRNENGFKSKIIFNGPILGGVQVPRNGKDDWRHAMLLVGFGKICAGDTIRRTVDDDYTVINSSSHLIGKTYWIFKNSYGMEPWDGYHYIVAENFDHLGDDISSVILPIKREPMNFTADDIVCEDKDGDGYFYWGIGPRPSSCPDCAPLQPDGDDSNPNLGPLNASGECTSITPRPVTTTNILSSQTWSNYRALCGDLLIRSGYSLTITGHLKIQPKRSIKVESGGTLNVNGGIVECGSITALTGSTVSVSNGGQILVATP